LIKDYDQYVQIHDAKLITIEYDDFINAYKQDSSAEVIITIKNEGTFDQDIYVKPLVEKPLVVFFHGATNRETRTPHVFEGFNLFHDVDASFLWFSDIALSLDDDITLGWHMGSSTYSSKIMIPAIINKIATDLKAPKIIFCGGSGGGFASLFYAKLFHDSIVFVWNPQTNILRYNQSHVIEYCRLAWGVKADNLESLKDYVDYDLSDHYQTNDNKIKIVYLQNKKDWHTKEHMMPFFEQGLKCHRRIDLKSSSNFQVISTPHGALKLMIGDWGEGHAAPPKILLKRILSSIVEAHTPKQKDAVTIDAFNVIENLDQKVDEGLYRTSFKDSCGIWLSDYIVFRRTQSPYCLVLCPSALTKERRRVPFFHRWSWGKELDMNVVVFSDPTLRLSNEILAGWCQGTENFWALESIVANLHAFFEKNGIETKNVIFAGSSMGGFLSLQLATFFEGSVAYAENAQVNLRDFSVESSLSLVAQVCYKKDSLSEVSTAYDERLDVVETWKKSNKIPNYYYVIKESDHHHHDIHYKYFSTFVSEQQKAEIAIEEVISFDQDNSGHTPLEFEEFKKRIYKILASKIL